LLVNPQKKKKKKKKETKERKKEKKKKKKWLFQIFGSVPKFGDADSITSQPLSQPI